MSRLTQLRQRIETVTNLQKTTHAMRLTSMSTHSSLQKQKAALTNYKQKIEQLLKQFITHPHPTIPAEVSHDKKQLIIIVGSQKGLCGAFNTRLMHLVEESYPLKKNNSNYQIISIGRKVTEYLEQRNSWPQASYNTFNATNFVAIARELCDIIRNSEFSHVTIFSNQPRTFFVQESMATELALPHKTKTNLTSAEKETYKFEESSSDLRFYIEQLSMKATIQDLLFKSLIAEQAARFVSMDSSTRNADQLIADMKTDYNKLRQALITRELTDLAGGVL